MSVEPSSFHISTDRLDEVPAAIDDKMDIAGLRATLEELLDILNSDHAQESEDQEFLYDLLDYTIGSLSQASEPVPTESLTNLDRLLSNFQSRVTNQDWANARIGVHSILQELSILPKASPPYQAGKAELNQAMRHARRALKASTTRLGTADEEHQQALDKAVRKAEAETSERFEAVLHATNLSARKATDQIDSLKERANEYLEEIREANRLTADAEVGGAHRDAEGKERDRADKWRWIAVGVWGFAVVAAGILLAFQFFSDDPTSWGEWALRMPLGLSIVGLVAAIGKYASKQSQGHRDSEWNLRSRALALRQLRLAVHDLANEEAAKALIQEVGPGLYSDHQASQPARDATPKSKPEITHVDGFSQKIILVSVLSSNVVALAIVVLALVL